MSGSTQDLHAVVESLRKHCTALEAKLDQTQKQVNMLKGARLIGVTPNGAVAIVDAANRLMLEIRFGVDGAVEVHAYDQKGQFRRQL